MKSSVSGVLVIVLFVNFAHCRWFEPASPTNEKYPFDETEVELPWYKPQWIIPKQVKTRPLLDYNCECGVENTVEGTEEFSWVVWITFWKQSEKNLTYEIKCGGSLINSLMILTNAQCANKFKSVLPKAFYQWDFQRVNVYMDSKPTPTATSIPIIKVIFHPDYSKGNLGRDVAILQLKTPVPFKSPKNAIRPICLPSSQDKFKEGSDAGVVLHYTDGMNNSARIINQNGTTAAMYNINECKKIFNHKIHGNFICAGPPTSHQLASRHFGSLLYIPLANDQNLQIGIWTSRHFGVRKNELSTLNLFIRIIDIIEFIEEASNTAGAKWCRHPRMKMNDTLPDSRLARNNTPWIGTTSENREILPSCTCGYRKSVQQSRIVGGSEAHPYEYPWIVLLQIDGGGISEGCGAAVINDLFILTAAHCLYDATLAESDPENSYPGRAPTSLAAAILVHSSDIASDKNAVVLEIEEVFMHPEFVESLKKQPYVMDYDLALLKLRSRLDFWSDEGPLPICLPNTTEVLELIGKQAIVAGWGMTNPDNPQESLPGLQHLEIPIKPLQECKDLAATPVTDRMLCAGTFNPRKDTLHGDSGGPLMFELPTKQMMEVGIVSWGDYDVRKAFNLDTSLAAALYSDVKVLVEYIDYYSKLGGAKWCSRNVPTGNSNPRQHWVNAELPARNKSSACACGVRLDRDTSGNTLNIGNEMPWLVLIMAVRENSTTYCSGSIINDQYVITSAECLKPDKVVAHGSPSLPTNVIHMQPMFRERNIVDFQSTMIIESVHLHPLYLTEDQRWDHDIALIKLKNRIDFSKEKLAPVCLPNFGDVETLNLTKLSIGLLTGWNKFQSHGQAEFKFDIKKQKLKKPTACGNQTYLNQPKTFICLESPDAIEQSMAGGPLQVEIAKNQYLQIGIIPGVEEKQTCIKSKKHKADNTTKVEDKPTEETIEPIKPIESLKPIEPIKTTANPIEPIEQVATTDRKKIILMEPVEEIESDYYNVETEPEEETTKKIKMIMLEEPQDLGPQHTADPDLLRRSILENFHSDLLFESSPEHDNYNIDKLSREKRGADKQCSMYTSISADVLRFIEFFSSQTGAVWCDQNTNSSEPVKIMLTAEDFGMEA